MGPDTPRDCATLPAQARSVAPSRLPTSVLRALSAGLVVIGFGLLLFACARRFAETGAVDALGLVIVNTLFACLYFARNDAKTLTRSHSVWALSLAGTLLPLFMRPGAMSGFAAIGGAVQILGIAVIIAAILSLWRSFGIVPANRGIRQGGLYRFVRHPLYAGEITFLTGFVLVNPSAWNIALWTAECALQVARARAEERFLSEDPIYREYCQRTRYRLVPLLF